MSIGNLKTDGAKGTNYPYQSKVLLSLNRIGNLIGATTTEFEAQLVIDTLSVVFLEVRVYDPDTETFADPIYFLPGSAVEQTPTGAVSYLAPAAPEAKTAHMERTVGVALVIPLGASSISIANVGAATGRVDVGLGPIGLDTGQTVNFDAGGANNTLGSITIDDLAGATEFLVIWIT